MKKLIAILAALTLSHSQYIPGCIDEEFNQDTGPLCRKCTSTFFLSGGLCMPCPRNKVVYQNKCVTKQQADKLKAEEQALAASTPSVVVDDIIQQALSDLDFSFSNQFSAVGTENKAALKDKELNTIRKCIEYKDPEQKICNKCQAGYQAKVKDEEYRCQVSNNKMFCSVYSTKMEKCLMCETEYNLNEDQVCQKNSSDADQKQNAKIEQTAKKDITQEEKSKDQKDQSKNIETTSEKPVTTANKELEKKKQEVKQLDTQNLFNVDNFSFDFQPAGVMTASAPTKTEEKVEISKEETSKAQAPIKSSQTMNEQKDQVAPKQTIPQQNKNQASLSENGQQDKNYEPAEQSTEFAMDFSFDPFGSDFSNTFSDTSEKQKLSPEKKASPQPQESLAQAQQSVVNLIPTFENFGNDFSVIPSFSTTSQKIQTQNKEQVKQTQQVAKPMKIVNNTPSEISVSSQNDNTPERKSLSSIGMFETALKSDKKVEETKEAKDTIKTEQTNQIKTQPLTTSSQANNSPTQFFSESSFNVVPQSFSTTPTSFTSESSKKPSETTTTPNEVNSNQTSKITTTVSTPVVTKITPTDAKQISSTQTKVTENTYVHLYPQFPYCTDFWQGQCYACDPAYVLNLIVNKCVKLEADPTSIPSTILIALADQYCNIKDEETGLCTECYRNYYFNKEKGRCLQVDPLCRTYDHDTGNCTTCYVKHKLEKGKCIGQ